MGVYRHMYVYIDLHSGITIWVGVRQLVGNNPQLAQWGHLFTTYMQMGTESFTAKHPVPLVTNVPQPEITELLRVSVSYGWPKVHPLV